jgi:hypothetical protein
VACRSLTPLAGCWCERPYAERGRTQSVPQDHHVKIHGRKWLIRFTRLTGDAAGWTFFADAKRPRILIDEKLRGGARLETILHEIAHAVLGPSISEESVTELARVQRRVLQMLNVREIPNGKE